MPSTSLKLYLDIGDVFTKAIAVRGGVSKRLRFPSVVARRLLADGAEASGLLLFDEASFPRPDGFDPKKYPRVRSYPGGERILEKASARGHGASGARFTGKVAVRYGADRELLGGHLHATNVEALVRKALLMSAPGCDRVELIGVVDAGLKAELVQAQFCQRRHLSMEKWTFRASMPEQIEVDLRGQVVDAPSCAIATLPDVVALARVKRLLCVDIGYLRTKLAVVGENGCEHQEQLDALGLSDCVRRVLRDGQEQGLVEDEFAIMRALEQSQSQIEVAGRSFEVGAIIASARRGLEEELTRAVERVLLDQYQKSGELCRAVAILGGGGAILGEGLATRLKTSRAAVETTWITDDPSYLLLEGARRLV